MQPLDYLVSPGAEGWVVTANGIDCGVVADRSTALRQALRWARRTGEEYGRHARVLVDDGLGPRQAWECASAVPALRIAAAAMHRPSAYFVRELAEFRPLYICG
ncbi:MAG: hypothetical protein IT534_11190 [Bauldia sp.]|nr:hypothetical protein [Bauldia sp.]